MEYKGNEIEDRMIVREFGAELCMDDEESISPNELAEYLEKCKERVERMKSDGFDVVGYNINCDVVEREYDEDCGGGHSITLVQLIERYETDLEANERIEELKKYFDHVGEVMEKCDENHKKRVERMKTDRNYAAYWYQMNILKRYGAKTITYEKWCKLNNIESTDK